MYFLSKVLEKRDMIRHAHTKHLDKLLALNTLAACRIACRIVKIMSDHVASAALISPMPFQIRALKRLSTLQPRSLSLTASHFWLSGSSPDA